MMLGCRPRIRLGPVPGKAGQAVAAAKWAQVEAEARPTRDRVRPGPSGTGRLRTGSLGVTESQHEVVSDGPQIPVALFGQLRPPVRAAPDLFNPGASGPAAR